MKFNTLYSIQYLRGLAAILVVFYHAYVYSSQYNNLSLPIPHEIGILAVLLFFVISGFIMSYLLDKKEDNFLFRRIVRIYPTYIFLVILVIFAKVLIFSSVSNPQLIYSITLLPWSNVGELSYPLGIEWSLLYEVFFYLFCSLMVGKFFTSSKKIALMFFWMSSIILYNFQYGEVSL